MRSRSTLVALLLAYLCAGCGSGGTATLTETASRTPVARDCPGATMEALQSVGHSLYEESATGRIVAQARYRLESSRALAEAVARGDRPKSKRVLRSLLLNQIVSVQVQHAGRALARIELGKGIAPSVGQLRLGGRVVGTFAVAVQGANGYAQTVSGLTGARVVVRSHGRLLASTLTPAPPRPRADQTEATLAGVTYRVDTFGASAFPALPVSVSLLVPSSTLTSACPHNGPAIDPAQARANAWGRVAERVYNAEHTGPKAQRILAVVASSRAFRTAVLAGDRKATRAAIIGFFRSHLHIVRVRVMRAGKLLIDVGGPHVLAPIRGTIYDARGRVAAHYELAIQDDLGFTLLARAFTGAQTLLRTDSGQAIGTLNPGPAQIPDRGRISYRGVAYQAYSFAGEAFPSGKLRISLLYPTS